MSAKTPHKSPILYVTREIERALGMPLDDSYMVVSNRTPYGESVKKQYPDFVTLIEGGDLLGTGDLIDHPTVGKLIDEHKAALLVFKNTARIEPIVHAHGWKLLNPGAALSDKIEGKLTQVEWLGELASFLPPHRIQTAKDIVWSGTAFIVQWGHGHTGSGTILIDSADVLKELQTKFPHRRARITDYVSGPSFTANIAVAPDRIAPGNISYQITGLKPFTDSAFTTIGNDWGAAQILLDDADMRTIQDMVDRIGAKMQEAGWRGLFGIDIIKDEKTGKIWLIEINARQPASAPFESFLQESMRAKGETGMTIFEAHIAALRGEPLQPIIAIHDGAQIIQRVTTTVKSVPEDAVGSLELLGYQTISYSNTETNSDLVRIQSMSSIMAGHNSFNDKGREIADTLAGV